MEVIMSGPTTPPSGSKETPAATASSWPWPFGSSGPTTPPPAQKKDGVASTPSSLETAHTAEDPTKLPPPAQDKVPVPTTEEPPANPLPIGETPLAAKTQTPEPTDSKQNTQLPPQDTITPPPPSGPTTWYGKAWASLSTGFCKFCSSLWSGLKWLVSPCTKLFSRTSSSTSSSSQI